MIKFVYFDIGGVLIKDFSNSNKWLQLESDFGVNNKNRQEYDIIWQRHINNICTNYDIDLMTNELKEAGYKIPANYSILKDGFIKRFYKNISILPIAQNINPLNTGMLSNMYPRMLNQIIQKEILPENTLQWRIIIDSSVVGFQKPDEQIFKIAINKSGYQPNQILFIDNSKEHLNSANKLGINTYYYDSANYTLSSKKLYNNLAELKLL